MRPEYAQKKLGHIPFIVSASNHDDEVHITFDEQFNGLVITSEQEIDDIAASLKQARNKVLEMKKTNG